MCIWQDNLLLNAGSPHACMAGRKLYEFRDSCRAGTMLLNWADHTNTCMLIMRIAMIHCC